MKDRNGIAIKLGDNVGIVNGETGSVVASIDTNEYTDDFSKDEWSYLEHGIIVRTDHGAVIHFESEHEYIIK